MVPRQDQSLNFRKASEHYAFLGLLSEAEPVKAALKDKEMSDRLQWL